MDMTFFYWDCPVCELINVNNRMCQYCGGVVVPDSISPGFDRIWDRDGSGPRFDPGQDLPWLLT